MGVVLEGDFHGQSGVIKDFRRLPNGEMGACEMAGAKVGDILVSIDGTTTESMPFAEVESLLQKIANQSKNLRFAKQSQHYTRVTETQAASVTGEHYSLEISVRRFRINRETRSQFVDYEVGCVMRVRGDYYRWTVWRRYSEFERMDTAMRKALGWQVAEVAFPPKYSMSGNKMSAEFAERRRVELHTYLQSVVGVRGVAEFSKHHCSADLRQFLDVDARLAAGPDRGSISGGVPPIDGGNGNGTPMTAGDSGAGTNAPSGVEGAATDPRRASLRRGSRRPASMRRRMQQQTGQPVNSASAGAVSPTAVSSAAAPAAAAATATAAPAADTRDFRPPPPPPRRASTQPPPPPPRPSSSSVSAPPPPPPPPPTAVPVSRPSGPPGGGARAGLLAAIRKGKD